MVRLRRCKETRRCSLKQDIDADREALNAVVHHFAEVPYTFLSARGGHQPRNVIAYHVVLWYCIMQPCRTAGRHARKREQPIRLKSTRVPSSCTTAGVCFGTKAASCLSQGSLTRLYRLLLKGFARKLSRMLVDIGVIDDMSRKRQAVRKCLLHGLLDRLSHGSKNDPKVLSASEPRDRPSSTCLPNPPLALDPQRWVQPFFPSSVFRFVMNVVVESLERYR